ncbi:transporter substrate-binding domain-containing diguanylate cyclase [Alteromonas gilva]|uniref:diguanylate cyclase n=1 Tax=Alteromonas gilva TaxID=2987522 RepID=A0ABT5L2N0_9ALTE|nr:GGDEF domain-containing protein [Alteromonas gilva]MDC8831305.1 GGDEF domain-containing protein [Alteromonas gilva]
MFKIKTVLLGWLIALCGMSTAHSKDVTFCINPDLAPYEMLRDGKHVGVSADYLVLIDQLTDIDFHLVETVSWHQSFEYVQTGKCMFLPMVNLSSHRSAFLEFTQPYFESPNVMLGRQSNVVYQGFDGLSSELLGVSKHSYIAEYLARYYPHLRIQLFDSESEGLRALNSGDIDLMVGPSLHLHSVMERMNLQGFVITGYAEPYNSFRMGVNKAYPELSAILDDAIERIPEAAKVDIRKRWSNVKRQYPQDFRPVILVIVCVVVLIATLFWRHNIMRRYARESHHKQSELENLQAVLLEKNRLLEFLSSHDSSTNLYNRNFMLHRAEDEVSRFNRFHTAATLILFDFSSHISRVGNEHNLFSEDSVRELARVCLGSVREVDIAGRWSAEQIIILCPQTPIAASKVLAERLKEAIETHPRDEIRTLPFSIGLAALKEGEAFSDWYERASQALYIARRHHNGNVVVAEQ